MRNRLNIKAVITIGGKGSRLHSITYSIIPKGLCRIFDKPLLSYQLSVLKQCGIRKILISAEKDWQIAELKQSIRIGEFPKLDYIFTTHKYGPPLNPLKTFRLKEVISFIGRQDFIWTYGDLFYDVRLLESLLRRYLIDNTSIACSADPKGLVPLSGNFIWYNVDGNGRVNSYEKISKPNLTIDAPFIFKNNVLGMIKEEARTLHPRGTRLINRIIDQNSLTVIKPEARFNINTPEDLRRFQNYIKQQR